MNFDVYKHTIFLVLSGSRAYGTHTATSDWDYRGLCIPPLDSYLGVQKKFEQVVDQKTKHVWKQYPDQMVQPDSDMQVLELTKFAKLACDANPAMLEILFVDSDSYVIKHPIM